MFTDKPFLARIDELEEKFVELRHDQTAFYFGLAKKYALNQINIDRYFYLVGTVLVQLKHLVAYFFSEKVSKTFLNVRFNLIAVRSKIFYSFVIRQFKLACSFVRLANLHKS